MHERFPAAWRRLLAGMLLLLLAALSAVVTHAQEGAGRDPLGLARPHLRTFGVQEGLPHGTVYSVLEDSCGRLWVSTREGLARFDGQRWIAVPLPAESPSQVVRDLVETPDGCLWAGTEHAGLWRFQGGRWTSFRKDSGLPSDRVNRLWVEPGKGPDWELWVGTSEGVARLKDGHWTTYGASSGLTAGWAWRFLRLPADDGSSAFLVATKKGFFKLSGERWTLFSPIPGFPVGEVNDIALLPQADGSRHMWITEWGKGLLRWNGKRWDRFDQRNGFPSQFPVDLCVVREAANGWILVAATYDAGLAWYQDGCWRTLDATQGLTGSGVYALAPSRLPRPTFWAGLREGGLVAVDMNGWRSFDHSLGLPDDEVLCLAETTGASGAPVPWIGTGRGIVRWEGGRWVVDDTRTGLPNNRVQALAAGDGVVLWAGTRQGLAKWNGRTWETVKLVPAPPDRQVQSLLVSRDPDGRPVLWIGLEEGLARLKDGRCETLPRGPDWPMDHVYDLRETFDPDGTRTLWAGTRGNGLFRLRSGRWTHYGVKDGLPNPSIHGLHEHKDAKGRRWLWVGTVGGGLLRRSLDQAEAPWEVFNRRQVPGLPTDTILSVTGDASGRVFLGTQSGVVRLCFEDAADPARPTRAETYTLGDGLPSLSCQGGALRFDRAGYLWVGTSRGAALLHPGHEAQLPSPGPLLMDYALLVGKPGILRPGVVLSHRENRLIFGFSLPVYHRESDVAFSTQVLGLDPEPVPWTHEGRRELSGLTAGSYTLRILGRDHLGRLTPPLDFPFRIRPAPWLSPWAFGIYATVLVLGILSGHRARTRRLHARNLELQESVSEATAEIERKRLDLQSANENLLSLNQELLDLNESLQRLNKEKDQFMGIAAHDLKNPLNAILLMGQDLGEGEADPDVVARFGKSIQRLSWQMAQIITDFLQVNMIDSERLKVDLCPVDLKGFLMDVCADFMDRARAKDIGLTLEIPEEPVVALADPAHLRSVMDNLVSNALKFTPLGPPIRLVRLRASRRPEAVCIQVQDEGPGFSAQDLTQAFQRFTRLSAKPTGGEPSTGLGLSIAGSLVNAMGGSLVLESEAGKGACFEIRLPEGILDSAGSS